MHKHVNVGRAFAVAAALTLGTSSIVAAQSTTRIPVSKEPPRTETTAEVVRVVDTVTVYRDRMMRDTVRMPGETRYVTDTLWRMNPGRQVGGLYFSLGGGASRPLQRMRNGYETGWNALAALGWQPVNSPLGVQLDASYNRFDRITGVTYRPGFAGEAAEPTMWTASGVGRLALPVFNTLKSRGIQIYGLGGLTYHVFKGLDPISGLNTEPSTKGGEGTDPDEWNDDFGFTAGGGVSLRLSRAELFVEGRRNWISAANYQTGYTPIFVGLTWR